MEAKEELLLQEKKKSYPNAPKSLYMEDFKKVSAKRPNLIVHKPDFHDIIVGPYVDPLVPDSKLDSSKWEAADVIYERIVGKYPSLKKVALSKVVDQSKLVSEYRLLDKSIYLADYCDEGQLYESKYSRLRQRIELPSDFGPVPKTIQRRCYREWKKLVNWIPSKLFHPPECELGFTAEEQKLLNITTGKTEYGENISDLGAEIIDYGFHGEMKILPHEYMRKN